MPKIYYINHKKASTGFIEEVEISHDRLSSLYSPAGRKKPFKEGKIMLAPKDWYEDKEVCGRIILRRLQKSYIAKRQSADLAQVIFNNTTQLFAKEGIEL